MESDFKSETFKIFCGKFLMILKHINPLIDWNGPVKCQNLFWTVWHKIFKSPVKQVWGSNKSCRWWFCQWALQIHYICPTESIQQCDLISTPFFMFSTDLRRSPHLWDIRAAQSCFKTVFQISTDGWRWQPIWRSCDDDVTRDLFDWTHLRRDRGEWHGHFVEIVVVA